MEIFLCGEVHLWTAWVYSGLNIPQRKIGLFIILVQVPKDIAVKQGLRKSPQVTLPCTFQSLLVNNLNIPIGYQLVLVFEEGNFRKIRTGSA